MKLSSLSCLAVHWVHGNYFFSHLSSAMDNTILSPLPPATLHCAAEPQILVRFVGLSAGPCLECTQQFSLSVGFRLLERFCDQREQVLSVGTHAPDWLLLYPKCSLFFLKGRREEGERKNSTLGIRRHFSLYGL